MADGRKVDYKKYSPLLNTPVQVKFFENNVIIENSSKRYKENEDADNELMKYLKTKQEELDKHITDYGLDTYANYKFLTTKIGAHLAFRKSICRVHRW